MSGKGTAMRLKHLHGKKLTRSQAIFAKCSDCMNDYVDGRNDCGITTCPLYPWMPYRSRTIQEGAEKSGVYLSEDGAMSD